MKVGRILSSNGAYLEAFVEVDGRVLCVMDEFSATRDVPDRRVDFEIEFTVTLSDQECWEEVFDANLERKTGVEWIDGWEYMAFGEVVSISPVRVNCGLFEVEDVVHTTDSRVVGEFVGFRIARLGVITHEI